VARDPKYPQLKAILTRWKPYLERRYGKREKVAEALDLDPGTISRLFQGHVTLGVSNCIALADLLPDESLITILHAAGKHKEAKALTKRYPRELTASLSDWLEFGTVLDETQRERALLLLKGFLELGPRGAPPAALAETSAATARTTRRSPRRSPKTER
jgi:hypothetical protein